MACCVIGSLLLVALSALVRTIKVRVLRIKPVQPEFWTLPR